MCGMNIKDELSTEESSKTVKEGGMWFTLSFYDTGNAHSPRGLRFSAASPSCHRLAGLLSGKAYASTAEDLGFKPRFPPWGFFSRSGHTRGLRSWRSSELPCQAPGVIVSAGTGWPGVGML